MFVLGEVFRTGVKAGVWVRGGFYLNYIGDCSGLYIFFLACVVTTGYVLNVGCDVITVEREVVVHRSYVMH